MSPSNNLMPIYEYRCQKCNKYTTKILRVDDRDIPQQCGCGERMRKLVSLPLPAIFVTTNRDSLVNTLNNDDKAYTLPGKGKYDKRYKQAIGNSLFNREKPVIGRGF